MTTVQVETARLSLRTVTMDDVDEAALSWNVDDPPLSREEAVSRVQVNPSLALFPGLTQAGGLR
jgi:hypothetical protein